MANKTSRLKFAKKSKKIALSFYSCQYNFSRKKTVELRNSWCHLYELTAFPEVGISLSENRQLIQTRQMSCSQVACHTLSSKLDSALLSVLWWLKWCWNLKTVVQPVLSFLLFVFLNMVIIYFKYFSNGSIISNSWGANSPLLVVCSSHDLSCFVISSSAAEVPLGGLCTLGHCIPVEWFEWVISQDLQIPVVQTYPLCHGPLLHFCVTWEKNIEPTPDHGLGLRLC